MTAPIPFNRPCLVGNELDYMAEAVASGHSASGGPFTRRAVDLLRRIHGAHDVLLTTSCTDALEMSALLVGIRPGDVVIVPSFTFTSTALAFAREGARLRFCDIEPGTLGLDPDHLETLLDDRVRAVVVVHYAGVPCDVDRIVPLCQGARHRPDRRQRARPVRHTSRATARHVRAHVHAQLPRDEELHLR
jgi:dTDP-4-amino-4,6-dideoxygalactose transaminase